MAYYTAVQGSETAHCCFSWSVVDATRRDEGGDYDTPICECFDEASARRIASALNEMEERNGPV